MCTVTQVKTAGPLIDYGLSFLYSIDKERIDPTFFNISSKSPEKAGGAEVVIYTWHVSERPPKLAVPFRT